MEKYWLGTMKLHFCMYAFKAPWPWRFTSSDEHPSMGFHRWNREEPPGGMARLRRCGALVLRSPQSQVFLERVAMTSNWDDWSWWLPYTTHDEAGDGGSYEHSSAYTRFVDVGSIIESSQPWWWGCQPRSRGFALWVLVRGRDPKTVGLWSSELWATAEGLHILLDRWRTTKLNMKSQSLSEIGIATHVPLICLNIFRLIGHLSMYPIIFWDWRLGKPHRSHRQVRIDDDSFGEATGPALTGGVHFPLTGERVNTEHRNHHVFWNVTRLTAFHVLSQNRARSWSQLDIYIYLLIN